MHLHRVWASYGYESGVNSSWTPGSGTERTPVPVLSVPVPVLYLYNWVLYQLMIPTPEKNRRLWLWPAAVTFRWGMDVKCYNRYKFVQVGISLLKRLLHVTM